MSDINAHELSNQRIGTKDNYCLDGKVVAKCSSPLAAIRPYVLDKQSYFPAVKPGYWAGTSGSIVAELFSDNAGQPGTKLATAAPLSNPEYPKQSAFPLLGFTPMVTLVKGTAYHIVFRNTDANMAENWQSVDLLYNEANVAPQCPDMEILVSWDNGKFVPEPHFIPSPFCLYFADGNVQGYGWIAADYQGVAGRLEPGTEYGFPVSTLL